MILAGAAVGEPSFIRLSVIVNGPHPPRPVASQFAAEHPQPQALLQQPKRLLIIDVRRALGLVGHVARWAMGAVVRRTLILRVSHERINVNAGDLRCQCQCALAPHPCRSALGHHGLPSLASSPHPGQRRAPALLERITTDTVQAARPSHKADSNSASPSGRQVPSQHPPQGPWPQMGLTSADFALFFMQSPEKVTFGSPGLCCRRPLGMRASSYPGIREESGRIFAPCFCGRGASHIIRPFAEGRTLRLLSMEPRSSGVAEP